MDILGTPDVGPLLFIGLCAASFVTAFIGVFTGTAGGVILLAVMAMVMPPAVVIPVHTVVMLGSGVTRTMIMWRHVMRWTLLPFIAGCVIGAAAGAKIFVALPISWLQGILGAFILVMTWMPSLGRIGAQRGRFAVLGFGTTFLGVFVSATGTLLPPFVASAAPDRHSLVATVGALMMFVHIAKLAAFGFIGFAIGSFIPLMAAMIVAGALGNWLGEVALHRTTEQRFRLVFQLILTVLALRLLWEAVRDIRLGSDSSASSEVSMARSLIQDAQTAPAVARNRDPILAVLRRVLPARGMVLEIASGTGEHAVHFAAGLPDLTWQPTDCDADALRSIRAHRALAQLPNLSASARTRRHRAGLAGDARGRHGCDQPDPYCAVDGGGGTDGRRRRVARSRQRPLSLWALQGGRPPHGAEQRGLRRKPAGAQSGNGACATSARSPISPAGMDLISSSASPCRPTT